MCCSRLNADGGMAGCLRHVTLAEEVCQSGRRNLKGSAGPAAGGPTTNAKPLQSGHHAAPLSEAAWPPAPPSGSSPSPCRHSSAPGAAYPATGVARVCRLSAHQSRSLADCRYQQVRAARGHIAHARLPSSSVQVAAAGAGKLERDLGPRQGQSKMPHQRFRSARHVNGATTRRTAPPAP